MADIADYKRKLAEAESELLAIVDDDQGWQKCQNVSKVAITSKKSKFFEGNVFKAVLEIDTDYKKVATAWAPSPRGTRQEWDKSVTSCDCIEDIDQELMVIRTVTPSAAMGLIASREFLDLIALKFDTVGNSAKTVGISVPHPKYPEQTELVRGRNHPCGAIFENIGDGKTKMTYIGHTSLGGNLPISLIEAAMPSSIHGMMTGLRKAVKQA